jgi:hypothetical protein
MPFLEYRVLFTAAYLVGEIYDTVKRGENCVMLKKLTFSRNN